MFGYIRPAAASLTEKEKSLYKSAYCGLCYTGSKKLSKFSKFFLNYDIVLLSLVRMILTREAVNIKTVTKRCRYKFKKVCIFDINTSQEYAVNAFFILLYFKLLDDLKDEGFIKKLKLYIIKPVIKHIYKKADKECPGLASIIEHDLDILYKRESEHDTSLDYLSDGFAQAMADISSYGLSDSDIFQYAYNIGYHIGRYIYIIDALDDLEEDHRNNRFNAIVSYYKTYEEAIKNRDEIIQTLTDSMICASNNLCKADIISDTEVLTHKIILQGSTKSISDILNKKKNRCKI